jgi:hypothetical protein
MISEPGLYWLATMGLITNYVGLARASDYKTQAVALAFGLLFFGVFTMTALGYYTVTNAGTVLRQSSQSLAVVGLLATAVTLLLLFDVAFRAIKSNT